MSRPHVSIRPVEQSDHDSWAALHRGYRDFYEHPSDDAAIERVWVWLMDPAHEVNGFVAEVDGELVGIAHYRRFARPSSGTAGMFLDDLFTTADARGLGVGRALIARVTEVAKAENCTVVRWITSESNTRARILYDSVATHMPLATYDITP